VNESLPNQSSFGYGIARETREQREKGSWHLLSRLLACFVDKEIWLLEPRLAGAEVKAKSV
jgi:hypothetical protein